MPQFDKRRSLEVPIEFNAVEDLSRLPRCDRVTLVLVTDGKAVISLNGETKTLISPCVLCLSEKDKLEVIENKRLYAQSFSLNPPYLRNRVTYKIIKNGGKPTNKEIYVDVLHLFNNRDAYYNGILNLPPDVYIKLFEWMSIIGTEINAQSDGRWTCRVRAYFLRILNLLDEICEADGKGIKINKQGSKVDAVLEYIHGRYNA